MPKDDPDFIPIDWKNRPQDYKYWDVSCWNPDSPQERQRNACLAADAEFDKANQNIRCRNFGDAEWHRQRAANLDKLVAARAAAQEEWERTGPADEAQAMAITGNTLNAYAQWAMETRAKADSGKGSFDGSGDPGVCGGGYGRKGGQSQGTLWFMLFLVVVGIVAVVSGMGGSGHSGGRSTPSGFQQSD
jgi:hypothetical protein